MPQYFHYLPEILRLFIFIADCKAVLRSVHGDYFLVEFGIILPALLGEGYRSAGVLIEKSRKEILYVIAPYRAFLTKLVHNSA